MITKTTKISATKVAVYHNGVTIHDTDNVSVLHLTNEEMQKLVEERPTQASPQKRLPAKTRNLLDSFNVPLINAEEYPEAHHLGMQILSSWEVTPVACLYDLTADQVADLRLYFKGSSVKILTANYGPSRFIAVFTERKG